MAMNLGDDWLEGELDLLKTLIKHPAATFYVRVTGDSMTGAGIFPGDILIVDRAVKPVDGDVIIACLSGEMTVRRLRQVDGVTLQPENDKYQPVRVTEEMDFEVFGRVMHAIHSF